MFTVDSEKVGLGCKKESGGYWRLGRGRAGQSMGNWLAGRPSPSRGKAVNSKVLGASAHRVLRVVQSLKTNDRIEVTGCANYSEGISLGVYVNQMLCCALRQSVQIVASIKNLISYTKRLAQVKPETTGKELTDRHSEPLEMVRQ